MIEGEVNNDPPKNRPRKKSINFLKNAKKYAKKGQTGRGTQIPEELYQYFVGILDAMKKGIENDEERCALVNNVLERTKGDELNIVGNQLGCRVIELLLPYSSPEDLERFIELLSPDLRKLCSDNFTSHVIETLVRVTCERAIEHLQNDEEHTDSDDEVPKKKAKLQSKTESKYTTTHLTKCHEFVMKMSKYALNNLEDFIWDQYANHILRSVLKCLSGIMLLPGEKPKTNIFVVVIQENRGLIPSAKIIYKNYIPEEFKDIVKEFVNRLSMWPQFKDLPNQTLTSGLLQVLLYAIKRVDKGMTRDLIKKLLNESFAPCDWITDSDDKKDVKIDIEEVAVHSARLPPVFHSESAVRLLEAALFVAKKKTYTQIYARCFINRLGQLASARMLNFTVQRLIDNCKMKEEFEPMFDELDGKIGEVLQSGNTGVLVALAKACVRIKTRQAQFVKNLEVALKCESPENQKYFSVLCLRLLPLDRIDPASLDKDYYINIHGSIVLQSILDFQRPAKAVNSLLELSTEELLVVLCDGKGCHVADAMCKGQCVGVKARDQLIRKLKGYYQKMALSQYGSRAFEKIFEAASPEQKVKIMTELSDKSNLMNSTKFGRLIYTKLDVATFKLSQKKWEEIWKGKAENQ